MICHRCGASLPDKGFLCLFCGTMMDQEQIKFQKEFLKTKLPNQNIEFIAKRYGKKGELFQKREKEKSLSFLGFLFFGFLFCFLLLLVVFSFI